MAGEIWRERDELWVRNLSFSHELWIDVPGQPPGEPMGVRHGHHPGFARAVGAELASLRGPRGCLLVCQQNWQATDTAIDHTTATTLRVSPVPADLRPVAAALCEPLLDGGRLPAAYSEIIRRLGGPTLRQVRNLIERLCRLYENESPELAARAAARRRRQEDELAVGAEPVLRAGVWVFPAAAQDSDEASQRIRRKALALPDYYEVAHLLVRRRLITSADIAALSDSRNERPA
ncbi:hypothetical protein AB0J80_11865 [Actinoplanes sp. NPDC049548]|uniref:hypothetical protein n=1 Tax=Actinoplanes sp. NPDC049548 TaxID=3155152 RepID=UPI003420648B